jgi:hypothetical protein
MLLKRVLILCIYRQVFMWDWLLALPPALPSLLLPERHWGSGATPFYLHFFHHSCDVCDACLHAHLKRECIFPSFSHEIINYFLPISLQQGIYLGTTI